MDLKTLKEKHPELVEAMKGEFSSQSKASAEVSEKVAVIEKQVGDIAELTSKVAELTGSNKELVKEIAILGENAASALANGIMVNAISESDIPEKLHGKAKATMPSFNSFVSEGEKFEKGSDSVVKFTEAVSAEVKSWEASLPSTVGHRVGASDAKDDGEAAEGSDVAFGQEIARMVSPVIRSDG